MGARFSESDMWGLLHLDTSRYYQKTELCVHCVLYSGQLSIPSSALTFLYISLPTEMLYLLSTHYRTPVAPYNADTILISRRGSCVCRREASGAITSAPTGQSVVMGETAGFLTFIEALTLLTCSHFLFYLAIMCSPLDL